MTKEELKRHYYLTKERKQIEAELEELRELKSVVKGQELDGMPKRMLLRYRYIDHMKWEEICVLMSYSWKQIHQIHNLALEQIKEV